MRVLFAVNANGLGHATRSYPLIKAILDKKHQVYLMSSGRALAFLKKEFGHMVRAYFEVSDYSLQATAFTDKRFSVLRFIASLPRYANEIREEHSMVQRLHEKYRFGRIISDTRYGAYVKGVPSYFLLSHIKLPVMEFGPIAGIVTEFANKFYAERFSKLLIPDTAENGIGGSMTHNFRFLKKSSYIYLGLLSMARKRRVRNDVEYFFSISGPEPQRSLFEKIILDKITRLKGRVVVTLGKTEDATAVRRGNITIYGCLGRAKQEEMLNRARLVIARSGYSTVMDLAELDKKAILIPTEGQPEQEYLAAYHEKLKHHMKRDLQKLELADLQKAKEYLGHDPVPKTKDAVRLFLRATNL